MSTKMPPSDLDKELARTDPAAVFETPEQVRDHEALTVDEKIEILRRWSYDDAEEDVAREEGMPGDAHDDLQRRVFVALQALGGDAAVELTGPTKQHGLRAARRTRSGPGK